ncbi:DUF1907-domain-containing protein [Microthyrium microscopicum]|uniref:DUF1907-domain-containing protein n=1 Tax=Microthyrium microscopicum TaxID=703497 RepID=A0A6A6UHW5_9PEZI|nr:DUF1907-domain-containing protein [Microthyrium microscopicum]
MAKWPVERVTLIPDPLEDIAACIRTGLEKNFKELSVTISQCPDLRAQPFNLAAAGLCGNPRVADVGGQPYLTPLPRLDKVYSLLDIIRDIELPNEQGFILGAGAGPFRYLGTNSELMPNLSYKGDDINNQTHYAKVQPDGQQLCEKLESHDCGLMANLFGSSGLPGPVIKIVATNRTGELNFITAITEALKVKYSSKLVSMGGVFVIRKGKANLHVMPDFSTTPLNTGEQVEKWLKFYDVDPPLVCLSVFHSCDPGLDLRMEHTHCFSDHGGGHYHWDVTPEEVQYEAYFNVAEVLYRIDRP